MTIGPGSHSRATAMRLCRKWGVLFVVLLLIMVSGAGCGRADSGQSSSATAPSSTPGEAPAEVPVGSSTGPPESTSSDALPATWTPVPRPPTRQVALLPSSIPTPPPPSPASSEGAIRSRIEIFWPQDGEPVRQADRANITTFLIAGPDNESPLCDWSPVVRLWEALNSEPAQPVAIGTRRLWNSGGSIFPVWDFNDVDISAAREPTNKLAFYVTVDGMRTYHNVWVHASDARSVYPQADIPVEVTDRRPSVVEARIEIVWPHDNLPVDKARQVNVTAYLYDASDHRAIAPDSLWNPVVRLHQALNAETEQWGAAGIIGTPRTVDEGEVSFRAWDFNDVDVSAARRLDEPHPLLAQRGRG